MIDSTTNCIIFLDIDGVLTMSRCLLEDYVENDSSLYFVEELCPHLSDYIVPLEISRIENLKWILQQIPNCRIVLSSTWREQASYKDFVLTAMKKSNINIDEVYVGDTPSLGSHNGGRGMEIKEWLLCNPSYSENSKFVIIDDDHKDNFIMCDLLPNLFETIMKDNDDNRENEGLTIDVAMKIVQYFNT